MIDPSFQGVNKLFFIIWRWRTKNNLETILSSDCSIKNYNVIIDVEEVFDQPVRNDFITYDDFQKIATGQNCSLDIPISNIIIRWYQ